MLFVIARALTRPALVSAELSSWDFADTQMPTEHAEIPGRQSFARPIYPQKYVKYQFARVSFLLPTAHPWSPVVSACSSGRHRNKTWAALIAACPAC
eukprot:37166-Pyramimonas_sp.AAC.1